MLGSSYIPGGTDIVRKRFATIRKENNYSFMYESGFDDTDIYPSE